MCRRLQEPACSHVASEAELVCPTGPTAQPLKLRLSPTKYRAKSSRSLPLQAGTHPVRYSSICAFFTLDRGQSRLWTYGDTMAQRFENVINFRDVGKTVNEFLGER